MSDKVVFTPKLVRRDKEGHSTKIIHQEEIAIVNLHVLNVGIPNFNKQTQLDLKGKVDPNTMTVEDFDPRRALKTQQRNFIQTKQSAKKLELKDTIDQMDLQTSTDHFIKHSTIKIFSIAHGTVSKMDHMLGHKTNLNKYKKIEITPCILSDHKRIK
jgi:hypothetical protein